MKKTESGELQGISRKGQRRLKEAERLFSLGSHMPSLNRHFICSPTVDCKDCCPSDGSRLAASIFRQSRGDEF
jgi:hypothetical protein